MKDQSVNVCPMCSGKKKNGTATFTVDLKVTAVVVRDVPASVCSLCGNEWINDDVAEDLEAIVDDAKKRKHIIEVTRFRKTT